MFLRRIKPRKKPRPGRMKGEELAELRLDCFKRDKGNCVECGMKLRWESGYRDSMHMAHIGAKRRYGDSLENVKANCGDCHRKQHIFGPSMTKPVPKKESIR